EGFEAEEERAVLFGDHRGDPIMRVAGIVDEAEQWVVAAIGTGHHGACRSEIDAEFHGLLIRRSASRDARLRSGRSGGPDPTIDEHRIAVVEHVVFADRPALDPSVGMYAEPHEVLVAGVAEDGEGLLVLDAEESKGGEVETKEEGAGERGNEEDGSIGGAALET